MGDINAMRIGYYTDTGEIWGYGDSSMVPDNLPLSNVAIISSWSGVVPEPMKNYKVVNSQVIAITDQDRKNRHWPVIREERNKLLAESDWTQSADSPLSDSDKTAWATYRQSLRDVTTQSDPFNITWPTSP
jgi:hypothetical protein